MKTTLPSPTKSKADVEWVKTPYPNLIRYKPSGNYFGRVRVNGKLIRRSLNTHVLTVAKLKLSDFSPRSPSACCQQRAIRQWGGHH